MTDNKAARLLFAYSLMVVGGLMTVLCGGCTVFFVGEAVWLALTPVVHHGDLSPGERYNVALSPDLGIGAIVGGLPTAVGVALFLAGRRRKR